MISILGQDKKHIDDIFIKACEDGKLELIELLFINAIDPLIYYDTAFIGACIIRFLQDDRVCQYLQNGLIENRIVQLLLQNEHIVRALQDLHINIVGLLHT